LVASKLAGKTEVSEKKNRPNDTFSTVNTKWPDLGSKANCKGKPATNRLSYDTASDLFYLHNIKSHSE
jgi:hypothetical protein